MSELQALTDNLLGDLQGVRIARGDYAYLKLLASMDSAEFIEGRDVIGDNAPGFNYRITKDQPFYYTAYDGNPGKLGITYERTTEEGKTIVPETTPHKCGFICGCDDNKRKWWGVVIFLVIFNLMFSGGKDTPEVPIENDVYDW